MPLWQRLRHILWKGLRKQATETRMLHEKATAALKLYPRPSENKTLHIRFRINARIGRAKEYRTILEAALARRQGKPRCHDRIDDRSEASRHRNDSRETSLRGVGAWFDPGDLGHLRQNEHYPCWPLRSCQPSRDLRRGKGKGRSAPGCHPA